MQSSIEMLSLKTRSLNIIANHYQMIFQSREELHNWIPKEISKELFSRLVNRGILSKHLFRQVVDRKTTVVDLKSTPGQCDDDVCRIIEAFSTLRVLFLTEVTASSKSLIKMFTPMHRLSVLEITNSPSFNDSVLGIIAENSPCLKVLNVKGTSVGDDGLGHLARYSCCLTALDISCNEISFIGVQKLISSPVGKTLREFKCRGCKLNGRDEILSCILGFKNLEDYGFSFASNDDADWVLNRVPGQLKNFAFNIPM